MTAPGPDATVSEAREYVLDNLDAGVRCPCCKQFAKAYRRKINTSMARAAVAAYKLTRDNPEQYVHVRALDSHEFAQLAWWGLIEPQPGERSDGGRNGWWRLTSLGRRWVVDAAVVPRYVLVFDGIAQPPGGDPTSVRDALGTRFNLSELMGWNLR